MSYTTTTKVKSLLGITNTDWDTSISYHITYVDELINNRLAEHNLSGSENSFFEAVATDWVCGRWLMHEGEASHEDSLDRGKALIEQATRELEAYIRDRVKAGVPSIDSQRRRVYIA